ncbi:unnamed protein product [Bemisia tabaci]|uniref:AAA-ATPase-like domain-containing protein n=1 Tax=Bemisia tabaci TaxID=7038 RepID=A0A9P0A8G7_BEMTA|nr:unnamed protein product [Bemisia tabaci]
MILQVLFLIASVSGATNTGGEPRNHTTFKHLTTTREFIDKTLLIKFILDNHWHIYIAAPPGFGKSTNLKMLRDFFALDVNSHGYSINAAEILKTDATIQNALDKCKGLRNVLTKRVAFLTDTEGHSIHGNVTKPHGVYPLKNYETFSKPALQILEQFPELFLTQFARYPVILLDFGTLSTISDQDHLRSFQRMLSELFKPFCYLLKSNRLTPDNKDEFLLYRDQFEKLSLDEITVGGETLARLLSTHHHRKSIVLVDNFDAPIREALLAPHLNDRSFKGIMWGVSRFVKLLIKSRFVHRTVVTGTVRVDVFGLTHFPIFDDDYLHRYYGLTEGDVSELAKRFEKQKNVADVRKWYGGYKTAGEGQTIYNTRSTLTFFRTGELKPYRYQCMKFKTLKNLLEFEKVGQFMEDAFDNKTRLHVREKIPQKLLEQVRQTVFGTNQTYIHKNVILQILLDHGFYTVQDRDTLHIPNFEAMLDIKNLIFDREYYINKLKINDHIIDNFVQSIERLTGEEASFNNFSAAVTELFKHRIPRGARETAHTLLTLVADAHKFSLLRGQETLESDRQDVLVKRSEEIGIVIGIIVGSINKIALKPVFLRSLQVFPDCKLRVAILLGLKPHGLIGDLEVLYALDNRTETRITR